MIIFFHIWPYSNYQVAFINKLRYLSKSMKVKKTCCILSQRAIITDSIVNLCSLFSQIILYSLCLPIQPSDRSCTAWYISPCLHRKCSILQASKSSIQSDCRRKFQVSNSSVGVLLLSLKCFRIVTSNTSLSYVGMSVLALSF